MNRRDATYDLPPDSGHVCPICDKAIAVITYRNALVRSEQVSDPGEPIKYAVQVSDPEYVELQPCGHLVTVLGDAYQPDPAKCVHPAHRQRKQQRDDGTEVTHCQICGEDRPAG